MPVVVPMLSASYSADFEAKIHFSEDKNKEKPHFLEDTNAIFLHFFEDSKERKDRRCFPEKEKNGERAALANRSCPNDNKVHGRSFEGLHIVLTYYKYSHKLSDI